MVEPLIRWLTVVDKGYNITSSGFKLASKWYADDDTFDTRWPYSAKDVISLLNKEQQLGSCSGIHLNVETWKITVYNHALQAIPRKKVHDDALRDRLAHVTLPGYTMGSFAQDEPLPGGYLGTSLTASLSPETHFQWTQTQLTQIGKALGNTPCLPI